MLRLIFSLFVVFHGFIHLMGFIKAFKFMETKNFNLFISRPVGILWLLAGGLFILTVILLLSKVEWWWAIAIPAVILSQILIITVWQEAKFGTIANIIVVLAAIEGFGCWQFNRMVKNELNLYTPFVGKNKMVTPGMLGKVPPVVQKWLRRSNVVGKNETQSVYLVQGGEMRTSPNGKWMPVRAEQWYMTQKPCFLWIADVQAVPFIHLKGMDKFERGKGKMLISLLSVFPVVNASGKKIDQGTMLRYLGEIVWFPSAALCDYIQWDQVDSLRARATMTYAGLTVSGLFKFDENGDVVSFEAKRYYDRKGGATLEDWFIQIEKNAYREFEGVRIPAISTVTWKLKEGDFTWFKVDIRDIKYNTK